MTISERGNDGSAQKYWYLLNTEDLRNTKV